jgi:uncharacterized protein (DUF1499 family)
MEMIRPGLLLFAVGAMLGLVLLLLMLFLLLFPKFRALGVPYRNRLLGALPLAVLFAVVMLGSSGVPPIHDITTDTEDPPLFTRAPELRGPDANPLDLDSDVIAQQVAAYPDLGTILSSLPPEEAFAKAAQIAADMGWDIYHQSSETGTIEAVDTTFWMGFKDDVVIRLRPAAQGTAIDLRSVSRVGVSDVGANANRIRKFSSAFDQ